MSSVSQPLTKPSVKLSGTFSLVASLVATRLGCHLLKQMQLKAHLTSTSQKGNKVLRP